MDPGALRIEEVVPTRHRPKYAAVDKGSCAAGREGEQRRRTTVAVRHVDGLALPGSEPKLIHGGGIDKALDHRLPRCGVKRMGNPSRSDTCASIAAVTSRASTSPKDSPRAKTGPYARGRHRPMSDRWAAACRRRRCRACSGDCPSGVRRGRGWLTPQPAKVPIAPVAASIRPDPTVTMARCAVREARRCGWSSGGSRSQCVRRSCRSAW